MEYIACCFECGKKKYGVSRLQDGITLHQGTCPFCKKEGVTKFKLIDDWLYVPVIEEDGILKIKE